MAKADLGIPLHNIKIDIPYDVTAFSELVSALLSEKDDVASFVIRTLKSFRNEGWYETSNRLLIRNFVPGLETRLFTLDLLGDIAGFIYISKRLNGLPKPPEGGKLPHLHYEDRKFVHLDFNGENLYLIKEDDDEVRNIVPTNQGMTDLKERILSLKHPF